MACPYCDDAVEAVKGMERELAEVKKQLSLMTLRTNDLLRQLKKYEKRYGTLE